MNKAIRILLAAAVAVGTSGVATASHVCAYVNDDVSGLNAAEGYMIGPETAVAHVGPYFTNGTGNDNGFYAGGLGAIRASRGDLYVGDAASDNITHFTINKSNCELTLDTTLYPSGDTQNGYGDVLAITPDGRTMFVGSTGDNHIYSHTIAAKGSLGATLTEATTPDIPVGVTVSADGTALVVSYFTIQRVCAYPITGGHLGTPNCQSTVGYPNGVAIDPTSRCVYAAEYNINRTSEIAAFALSESVLGAPTDYNSFGPGVGSNSGILVNWNKKTIYVNNPYSAQMTMGSIAAGCNLTYTTIISDGSSEDYDIPGQIGQAKTSRGYVVSGSFNVFGAPSMGIFQTKGKHNLTPIGSGQFPLMSGGVFPTTVVVIGAASP